jgi:hypothetical protein
VVVADRLDVADRGGLAARIARERRATGDVDHDVVG